MKNKKRKIICIAVYFILLIIVNIFVISIAFVFGDSMLPTLRNNEIVLLYKFNYTPQSGDVVITNSNNSLNANLVKRVVATPGQTVVITDGKLLVDGTQLKNYDTITSPTEINIIVPENQYFLVGDNFYYSKDSRDIGTISKSDILGKAIFLE